MELSNKKIHDSTFGYYFNPDFILWDKLPDNIKSDYCENNKKCLWCKKDSPEHKFCDIKHELYFDSLKERMQLDFKNISEALPYDKNSVMKFVNNKMNWKD